MLKGLNLQELSDNIKDIYARLDKKADKKELDDLLDILKKLREELAKLREQTDANTSDLLKFRGRLELIESKLAQLMKLLNELSGRMDKLGAPRKDDRPQSILSQATMSGPKIEEDEWNEIKKTAEWIKRELADLAKEVESLKDLRKRVNTLEGLMDTKLDRDEFEKWRLNNDINQILSGLLKKFADRNEMLKLLKKLENRILILEEMMSKEGQMDNADNAMFAKKPLGGWSCASCQKDLVNIEGLKVQYYPWAKMPQRNPAERIAKVGQGFSRMLSMLKPELITKSQQVGVLQRKGFYEDDPRMAEEEEPARPMARTHGQGFMPTSDPKRPNTANAFPNISHGKVRIMYVTPTCRSNETVRGGIR